MTGPDPRPPFPTGWDPASPAGPDLGPTSLEGLGEFGLIARLRARLAASSPGLVRGIGDDAAVLAPTPGFALLATADALIEEVHFSLRLSPPRAIGYRAMISNLSDIAAMGGIPRAALVCLGLPPRTKLEVVDALYEGLQAAAAAAAAAIVGGDTVRSPAGLVLAVTVLGEVERERCVSRAGARPGDRLWVSGPLGGSAAGLAWLQRGGGREGVSDAIRDAVACHEAPAARLALGRALALDGMARAMLDVSDGLGGDARRIAEESGVGVRIEAARVPVHPGADEVARRAGGDPLRWALSGGEDYELLFAADAAADMGAWAARRGMPAPTCVGLVVPAAEGFTLVAADGSARSLPGGYDHLAS
jgi:thiamine-monophosphate kinase